MASPYRRRTPPPKKAERTIKRVPTPEERELDEQREAARAKAELALEMARQQHEKEIRVSWIRRLVKFLVGEIRRP